MRRKEPFRLQEYNVPPAFSPPPRRKTPPIKHTNCSGREEDKGGERGEDLSDELPRRIEYSLNTPSFFL